MYAVNRKKVLYMSSESALHRSIGTRAYMSSCVYFVVVFCVLLLLFCFSCFVVSLSSTMSIRIKAAVECIMVHTARAHCSIYIPYAME